jgi:hypothetical protein
VQDNQPIELRVQLRCRALIGPLTDNAMDEAIHADLCGKIVRTGQDRLMGVSTVASLTT